MLILLSFILFSSFNTRPQKRQVMFTGFAVIELFTSEGCSSCPPADELLLKLTREYAGKTVYLLSFHVDYWDKLGWKDPFSDHAFTERQQHYGQLFNVRPYTPQAIYNGKKELIGSESGNIHNLINNGIKKDMPENSVAFSSSFNGHDVTVNYHLHSVSEDDLVNVALVQERAVSRVTAGENKGTTIAHANVVRVFKTVKGELNGSVKLNMPDDMVGSPYRLILYVQNKEDWYISCGNTLVVNPVRKVVRIQ